MSCLTILTFQTVGQSDQNKIQLANEYYVQGEIEKAKIIYQDLAEDPSNTQLIASNYLNLLKAIDDFETAEDFLASAIKSFPSNMQYPANLAGLYNEYDKTIERDKLLKRTKEASNGNPFQLSILAQFLANEGLYEASIDYFLSARELRGNPTVYALELATVYRLLDEKQAMIEEYLNYASDSPSRLNYIKNLLQNYIQDEDQLTDLEVTLIRKMQDNPEDTKYAELLLWVELQRKNFYGAFVQARAIDKRFNRPGDRSMDIGRIALENDSYQDAEDIFQYVIRTYPDSRNYQYARRLWLQSREKKIKNTYPVDTVQIRELAGKYQMLYNDLYPTPTAFEAIRSKALLHAFYLDEIDLAANYLQSLISDNRAGMQLISESKLDLGDIFLLKGEPWEATLLYSQVEKTYKSHPMGYEAKLRNARLHYFTGNFALAKGHLDILKNNTTREISNDALALGMLITDNTALDTTDAVMQEFANVELLIFRNQDLTADAYLDTMLARYEHHSITDEIYWLKSKLKLKGGDPEIAISYLDKILGSYAYDILADDAAFKKAEIYEEQLKKKEEAQQQYQQFLIDYPGSMYAAEARKRFRRLRGDLIN